VSGQFHAPATLPPGKEIINIYYGFRLFVSVKADNLRAVPHTLTVCSHSDRNHCKLSGRCVFHFELCKVQPHFQPPENGLIRSTLIKMLHRLNITPEGYVTSRCCVTDAATPEARVLWQDYLARPPTATFICAGPSGCDVYGACGLGP
jgi:hypothetical protein